MRKTTVYLPEDLKRGLSRLAARVQVSEAELIRRAVADLLASEATPAPRVPLFASGDPTLAERVDEVLADGFGR